MEGRFGIPFISTYVHSHFPIVILVWGDPSPLINQAAEEKKSVRIISPLPGKVYITIFGWQMVTDWPTIFQGFSRMTWVGADQPLKWVGYGRLDKQ